MKERLGFRLLVLYVIAGLVGSMGLPAVQSQSGVGGGAPTMVSYQGQVLLGGTPFTGTGYFKFAVVDAAGTTSYWSNDGTSSGGGEPAGAVQLSVSLGLFNVLLGDTGLTNMTALPASAFSGTERYLRVWFSSDGSTFLLLAPDRRIAAVPYALQAQEAVNADTLDGQHAGSDWSLAGNAGTTPGTNYLGTSDNQALELKVNAARALRLEPAAYSPNLIGGHSSNWLTSGVYGATIGGGGNVNYPNRVTDIYGTVGGGEGNQAGDNAGDTGDRSFATVGGGYHNTASGSLSTVGGGFQNTASGNDATVGGGFQNTASGRYATIAGGDTNTASGGRSTVGGGFGNQATNTYATVGGGALNRASNTVATVGGGAYNTASGNLSTIAGGRRNTASAERSTVGGGESNIASGYGATVPGGVGALADHVCQLAHASGSFAGVAGSAQASQYVLRRELTMAAGAWHDLFLDESLSRLTIASGRTMTFDILITARTAAGDSGGYRIAGVIENVSGVTALVGTPVVTVLGEDVAAWDARVIAGDTNDALLIQVQGNGETIRWVAVVDTAEVAW